MYTSHQGLRVFSYEFRYYSTTCNNARKKCIFRFPSTYYGTNSALPRFLLKYCNMWWNTTSNIYFKLANNQIKMPSHQICLSKMPWWWYVVACSARNREVVNLSTHITTGETKEEKLSQILWNCLTISEQIVTSKSQLSFYNDKFIFQTLKNCTNLTLFKSSCPAKDS